ncbi:15830_t:CDS:1, partial [Racocetra persica]
EIEVKEIVEEIVEETMEDIAEIAEAAESAVVAEEQQVVEQLNIVDNLYKEYINKHLIKYHQENLKQPDITELQKKFNNEKLNLCNKKK